MPVSPRFINPPCPHLPEIDTPLPITHTRKHRESCGSDYFQACLELAQSLWRSGSPAQAILQLDKSFMASITEDISQTYQAIIWIIQNTPENQFLGNPVRHFQHLATRMNMKQPNANLRIWRAWACLHLAEKFSTARHPRDEEQISKEDLSIPSVQQVIDEMSLFTDTNELKLLSKLLNY
ncbi:MAG: hypothetical protein ACI9E1_000091 [Cryomorphaceae bacterium]|jgi:hypothetical protein